MRLQKQIWEKEHKNPQILPSLEYTQPSSGVIKFLDFLNEKKVKAKGKAIDIGAGKGRNAIYLSKIGYEVYAMDYIKEAIDYVNEISVKDGVSVKTYITAIDKSWPFENDFFDIAIDCFSSIDIETKEGRKIYLNELVRTLKPGGYAMVMVVSVNDQLERDFLKFSPGKEKNSTVWPNGKFQKNYDEEELRSFYSNFKILRLEEISKTAFKLGQSYKATNYWLILQKPL